MPADMRLLMAQPLCADQGLGRSIQHSNLTLTHSPVKPKDMDTCAARSEIRLANPRAATLLMLEYAAQCPHSIPRCADLVHCEYGTHDAAQDVVWVFRGLAESIL